LDSNKQQNIDITYNIRLYSTEAVDILYTTVCFGTYLAHLLYTD